MKVFIENEAGKNIKNIYDEKTLEFKKSVEVSAPYPLPYGFILNTTSGDGDNLDCFILTNKEMRTGQVVDAEAIALLEMYEDGELDHKAIARINGEAIELDDPIKQKLVDFLQVVFSHLPNKRMEVGNFLSADAANELVKRFTGD
jgi:inorganic pyrophosphatase